MRSIYIYEIIFAILPMLAAASSSSMVSLPFSGCSSNPEKQGGDFIIRCEKYDIKIKDPSITTKDISEDAGSPVQPIPSLSVDKKEAPGKLEKSPEKSKLDSKDKTQPATEHGKEVEKDKKTGEGTMKKGPSEHDKTVKKEEKHDKTETPSTTESTHETKMASIKLECHQSPLPVADKDGIHVNIHGKDYLCKEL
jgi:hypothetical protein